MADVDIPVTGLVDCQFSKVSNVVSASFGAGAKTNITETMTQAWRVKVASRRMRNGDAERFLWDGFVSQLAGGLNRFVAYDLSKYKPLEYLNYSSPQAVATNWDGAAGVLSLSASGDITLQNLPTGIVLTVGDYIGLEEGGALDLYEVIVGGVSNGSGNLALKLHPAIKTGFFSTDAVARLWKPKIGFTLDGDVVSASGPNHKQYVFEGVLELK